MLPNIFAFIFDWWFQKWVIKLPLKEKQKQELI